jgi:hypothetical protein
MAYWRKLFIVFLLALSLPVQSFAAVSMKCVAAHAEAQETALQEAIPAASERLPDMHVMALADNDRHDHPYGSLHHAHSCSTCASCCSGTGLPAAPAVTVPLDATRVVTLIPPSAGVASFLTDGIERPPRRLLV